MRSIIEIYHSFGIPEKLQMHMLRVAACSKLIVRNWNGENLDAEMLYRVLLLHDMGNLVKISENEYNCQSFRKNRAHYYSLFGYDDHAVSLQIGKELGLSEKELKLMEDKVFVNNEYILSCDSFETKIGAYCDQRVAPDGVLPLLDRLNQAKIRYKNKPNSSMNNPKTDYLIECAVKIEKQVMNNCLIKPKDVNDTSISEYIEQFRRYQL